MIIGVNKNFLFSEFGVRSITWMRFERGCDAAFKRFYSKPNLP